MTTPERRQILYSKILRFMKLNKANTLPIDLNDLCNRAGVDLVPLSTIVRDTGLTAEEVFAIWGNKDGTVNYHRGRHRIGYNDAAPSSRMRFTICEELAHMVYGHTEDPDFNMFRQDYESQKYAQYDEEARIGAGFLVCHPRFFFTYDRYLKPAHLAELCDISLPCAEIRYEVYQKYKGEITSNITYQFTTLPRSRANLRRIISA